MNSEAIFLSYFIDEHTPSYGGIENAVKIERIKSIEKGDSSNNLELKFPAHIGTHIDFPFHFSNDGKKLEDYPPSFWIFNNVGFIECDICEVENSIKKLESNIECLILKTGFSAERLKKTYWSNQPIIPSHFAKLFKKKFPQLKVFGFDMISLTSKLDRQEGKKAHIEFLIQNDILVLEDMCLDNLKAVPNKLIIAPLQIRSADGVPCTVIAY
jgi:kynurenine formamidase